MEHVPGSILLQRPLHNLWWCVKQRRWPGFLLVGQTITALVIMVLARSFCSHSLVALDKRRYLHTCLGRVRLWEAGEFPPGYLETCVVLAPNKPWGLESIQRVELKYRIKDVTVDLVAFFLTPLRRWTHYGANYTYHDLTNGLRPFNTITNCTHLTADAWFIASHDITSRIGICKTGLYPSDFFVLRGNVFAA